MVMTMTDKQLPALPDQPSPKSRWRHVKSGGVYQVMDVGYLEATLDIVVIYESADHITWVRPWSEFSDGRFQQIEA